MSSVCYHCPEMHLSFFPSILECGRDELPNISPTGAMGRGTIGGKDEEL